MRARRRVLLMRVLLLGCLLLAACEDKPADTKWFESTAWDDGKAVLCVYKGRFHKYGTWRDAEARDYLIREALDPDELTKRDAPGKKDVRVIKANRHVSFNTGTYDYRLMTSLFFARDSGALVKAVASSQDGCGLTMQRWDRRGILSWDSYWEGEGRGERPLKKKAGDVFADELPFIAYSLADGAKLTVHPSLARNKVRGAATQTGVVKREGSVVRVGDFAEFRYDDGGFLASWKIEGEQEFERVVKRRLYYWQHTSPGDRRLLEPGK